MFAAIILELVLVVFLEFFGFCRIGSGWVGVVVMVCGCHVGSVSVLVCTYGGHVGSGVLVACMGVGGMLVGGGVV